MVFCGLDDPPSDRGTNVISASSARTCTVRSVLGSVPSGRALLSLKVNVWPSPDNSYGVDRPGLLDLLLEDEMLAILSRFPELHHLHFALEDNDREHDAVWWMAEIVRRLPDSYHSALSVRILLMMYGVSCGPVQSGSMGTIAHASLDGYQHLWHTPEEIEAAEQAEKAAKKAAEEAAKQAAELALQRALYEDELLLADVVCMLDEDGTIYELKQEQGVAGAEQLARERDDSEADV